MGKNTLAQLLGVLHFLQRPGVTELTFTRFTSYSYIQCHIHYMTTVFTNRNVPVYQLVYLSTLVWRTVHNSIVRTAKTSDISEVS